MTNNDLVTLAEALRIHNQTADGRTEFTPDHLLVLADFCASQNPNLDRRRWIDYITGEGRPVNELTFVESGLECRDGILAGYLLCFHCCLVVRQRPGDAWSGCSEPEWAGFRAVD